MARGGYQKPKGAQPASGVGKFARRTDGNEPPRTPNVSGSDLRYGDRQMLEQGQSIAPRGKAPSVAPSGTSSSPRGAGGAGPILDQIARSKSNRQGEPITAGMDGGPGPGSDSLMAPPPQDENDLLASYLERLAFGFNSKVAVETLTEMRTGRAPEARPIQPRPAPQQQQPAPQQPTEEEDLELFADEELEAEASEEVMDEPPVSETIVEEPVEEELPES